jgi:hypothetical protein
MIAWENKSKGTIDNVPLSVYDMLKEEGENV